MKQTQLEQAASACTAKSIPFIYVECRGAKAEQIKYISKKDGKSASFEKLTISCETLGEDSQQMVISRDLTEAEKKQGFQNLKSPYKKGARLFVVLASYQSSYGKTEARALSVEEVE